MKAYRFDKEPLMAQEEAQHLPIAPGEVILLTNGEYSDYTVIGLYKTLMPLSKEVIESLASEVKEEDDFFPHFPLTRLTNTLVEQGYLSPVIYREVYLGAYGALDIDMGRDLQ